MNLNDTLESNRGNLDESLENIRVSSQNLKQFTDTIKQRPFSLIRIKAEKDRLPPTGKFGPQSPLSPPIAPKPRRCRRGDPLVDFNSACAAQ